MEQSTTSSDIEIAIIHQIERFGHLYNPSQAEKDIGKPRISFTENCLYPDLIGKTWIIEEISGLADKGYKVNPRSRCSIISGILGSLEYNLKEGKDFEIIYPQ